MINFWGAFYGVLIDLLVLDSGIEERIYIKIVIFSIKYVVSNIFISCGKY
jgi:hypothetical protein